MKTKVTEQDLEEMKQAEIQLHKRRDIGKNNKKYRNNKNVRRKIKNKEDLLKEKKNKIKKKREKEGK